MFARLSHSTPTAVSLALAQSYLKEGRQHKDARKFEAALVLYDQAKVSFIKAANECPLFQAKEALRKARTPETTEDQDLRDNIAAVYLERGDILKEMGKRDKARSSYEHAKKWGHEDAQSRLESLASTSAPVNQASVGRDVAQVSIQIFPKNVPRPVVKYDLPYADERLTGTPQLAYCLSLLPAASLSDEVCSPTERAWLHAVEGNTDEQERLYTLATDLLRAFINDELKEAKTVAEVTYLAPAFDSENFRKLLAEFVDGIAQTRLLDFNLLQGLAQLIQSAAPDYLRASDLAQILEILTTKLHATLSQATEDLYQLTLTVSNVLDAMADSQVTGLARVTLHEPLSAYLQRLQGSSDPYLVYQAAYAFQALQYVPDDESPWQTVWRRTGRVIEGFSGLVSAVKGLDLNEFIRGLLAIHEGVAGQVGIQIIANAYDEVISLTNSGQSFLKSLQESLSFGRKKAWYKALRGADTLLQNGQFADFKQLVCTAPCRRNPAFQWGLCERLGQLAANPLWEVDVRQSAIDFLGELYKDYATWGQQANVKQWIIKILIHLSNSSVSAEAAKTLLQDLKNNGDVHKRNLYQTCLEEGPIPYPLNVPLPPLASPSLLDRVQNKPNVEADLRKLKHRRLEQRGEAVYISPQGKPNLQAPDTTLFDLTDKVKHFLSSDQEVLLLLGDSGAGKSTFNKALEADLWESYQKGGRIPLFIPLPAIDKPEQDLIAKHLRKEGFTEPQIIELKDHHKFVLICDGYDESQQTHNLYMSNRLNQPGEWRAQMVISCRSEYLGLDYRDRFQPMDRNHRADLKLFQEAVVAPFSPAKIQDYINQYVRIKKPLWQAMDYQQALERIPHLKELVRNPFLLTLSLEVLPRLVNPEQDFSTTRITRIALYDQFVEHWLERGKKRLAEKGLSAQERLAFDSLTHEGFTQNGLAFLTKLAAAIYEQQAGNPVVEYSRFRDEGTWKEAFFGRDSEKQLLREASPLNRNGNQYRFIHKSLLEYGVARAIFEPQESGRDVGPSQALNRHESMSPVLSFESQSAASASSAAIELPLLDSPLARKNLVGAPFILEFLAERVQQEPLFKQQLLAVIERSKTDKAIRKAAANAITILIRAGVQFNGADLRGIQIPDADLSKGVFDSAQLQGADLRKANLRKIWLRQANLDGAKMAGVQFGEWPYLQENSAVMTCTYSPDGTSCAVGLENGTISVYDASNWKKIHTLRGHIGLVRSVVYSPNGQQIASGSYDATVRLWDVQSGELSRALHGHTGPVYSLVYSPNGQQIASGNYDTTVRLWDVQSGELSRTLRGHTNLVRSVAYSPNGQQIASGSEDTTVRLWDVQSGEPSHILRGHTGSVRSVVYSPNGQQIASSSQDTTVQLWDVQSGEPSHILRGHTRQVSHVVYSPNGQQIASGSLDTTVRLWDAQSGEPSRTLRGHTSEVWSVAYSPNGQQIASGSEDTTVRLWGTQSGEPSRTLRGYTDWVRSMVYSPNGQQIASGCGDTTVRVWDVQSGQLNLTLRGHTGSVWSVVYSPNGQQIASSSQDTTVRLWDAQSGEPNHILRGHAGSVRGVVYSPNGEQIASSSQDTTVRLWDAQSGEFRHSLRGHTGSIWSMAYSPNGEQIASGSWDETVRLWDAQSGEFRHTLRGHNGPVWSVVYSPNSEQIASGSYDTNVRLWDAQSGELRHTLRGHNGPVWSVVYSPSDQQIASVSEDSTIRLWDAQPGELSHILTGHTGSVWSVAYSPNGQQIASGSDDNTVRLWDVASGQCLAVIQGFHGTVMSVAWKEISNNNYLVTGCKDRSVRLWRVIKEGDQVQVRLCWSSTHALLTVTDTSIQDVQGLNRMNKDLLEQRGAVGEPSSHPYL